VNSVRSILPDRPQGARQGVAGSGGRKFAQDHRRDNHASLNRGLQPDEFSPLACDRRGFDGIADQWLK
jgi:hypothetical protein